MNTSSYVLETLRLLRFMGIDIFFNLITLYQGDNSENNSKCSIFETKDVIFNFRKIKTHITLRF